MAGAKRGRAPIIVIPVADVLGHGGREPDEWFAWCRLLALARQRFACSEATYPAAVMLLARRDLCWVLGRSRVDHALAVLAKLQEHEEVVLTTVAGAVIDPSSELAPSQLGASSLVMLRKYAELQRFAAPTTTPETPKPPLPPHVAERERRARRARSVSLDQAGQQTITDWLAKESKAWT